MLRSISPGTDSDTQLRAFGAFKEEWNSMTKAGVDLDALEACLVQGTYFIKNDLSFWNIEISDVDRALFFSRKTNGSRLLSTNISPGDVKKDMPPSLGFTFILPDNTRFSIKLIQFKERVKSSLKRTDTIRLELDQFS